MTSHETYMTRCLALARVAKANGQTAVGSLIVKDDQIISEGIEGASELPAVLAHAEIVAIVKAIDSLGRRDLSNCILYTTVEPCIMCSYIIRQTGIRHVLFGVKAGHVGGYSSDHKILIDNDVAIWRPAPQITFGILATESQELLTG